MKLRQDDIDRLDCIINATSDSIASDDLVFLDYFCSNASAWRANQFNNFTMLIKQRLLNNDSSFEVAVFLYRMLDTYDAFTMALKSHHDQVVELVAIPLYSLLDKTTNLFNDIVEFGSVKFFSWLFSQADAPDAALVSRMLERAVLRNKHNVVRYLCALPGENRPTSNTIKTCTDAILAHQAPNLLMIEDLMRASKVARVFDTIDVLREDARYDNQRLAAEEMICATRLTELMEKMADNFLNLSSDFGLDETIVTEFQFTCSGTRERLSYYPNALNMHSIAELLHSSHSILRKSSFFSLYSVPTDRVTAIETAFQAIVDSMNYQPLTPQMRS